MASSTTSIDWMPAKGRHPVNIGSSLGRALKNRKNKGSPAAATKRSNLPERDFYGFKFNFKASSVDTSRPATIEIKKGAENNHITAEYPSTQPGEVHMFSGNEQTAKDVDCILIFDEETGTFTLEKLDSFVLLKFDRKQAASSRPDSPAPIATSSSSSAKGKGRQVDYDMDHGISAMDEDAEGEVDDAPEAAAPSALYHRREEEEEEEEGEEVEIPLRQAIQSKAKAPPSAVPPRPIKQLPKARPEAKAPPPPQPTKPKMPPVATPTSVAVPTPATTHKVSAPTPAHIPAPSKAKPSPAVKTKKTKTPLTSYASEEIIEFGRPAKRVRPSTPQQPPPPPPPPAPVELSLPGGSSSFAPPPAPASYRPPTAGSSLSNNGNGLVTTHPEPVVSAPMDADLSEEDEDWEQVPTATPTIPQAVNPTFSITLEEENQLENQLEEEIFGNGFAEEEEEEEEEEDGEMEEIDPFELEEQMEEEGEDFLNGVLSPAPQQQETRRPISMNELAGGSAPVVDSDDEFSSSDDSEDD